MRFATKTAVFFYVAICLLACNRSFLIAIDDASKPFSINLAAPENVRALEVKATGQIWGHGRLFLFRDDDFSTPWQTMEIVPVAISGIEIAIREASLKSEFFARRLAMRYEPEGLTQGHLEIRYRFDSR